MAIGTRAVQPRPPTVSDEGRFTMLAIRYGTRERAW
jgi:hypothetical protein